MMKSDIETRGDIETMLKAFYEKVFQDELIGHFFTEVVPLNLEAHLPLIADFWESVLFQAQTYRKNVMAIHQQIHQLSPIEKKHLDRWVQLFSQTIDELFKGNTAELAKQRALSIATLIDIKMNGRSL